MKSLMKQFRFGVMVIASMWLTCTSDFCFAENVNTKHYQLTRIAPSTEESVSFDANIDASPLLDLSQDNANVIVSAENGVIAAIDAESGKLSWKIILPAPENQEALLVSTPAKIDNKLIVLYQTILKGTRTSHRLAVVDLAQKKLDETFPILVLSAEKPSADGSTTVKFDPAFAFSHSAVLHAKKAGSTLGFAYAAFGNQFDTQPYHGWMFEIDLDTWHKQEITKAISAVLLTTPEAKCPVTYDFSTREMICAGGIWAPSGPILNATNDSYELIVPIGNGQIDLARHDYANTLMRLQPGLQFTDGCDATLCQNFNPKAPSQACTASCKNLFIPRLTKGNRPLKPASGDCDKKSFWECLAWMDYDLGANSPVIATLKNGQDVIVQPGKDGGVYLIDAKHFGTLYERLPITETCGTSTDACKADWMGMIVTQPAITYINKEPIVIIPTFIADESHSAGLVALKVVLKNGKPRFKRFWQFPKPSSQKAKQLFRSHPSLPVVSNDKNGDAIVWAINIGEPGTLFGIRVKDGLLIAQQTLQGTGRRMATPLVYKDRIYLASVITRTKKSLIEAYKIEMP
jgi:hypothetical protein